MNKHNELLTKLLHYRVPIMLFGILLIGIFFRLYNTPDRFGFDHDPTRDALIAIYGSENFKFPLTGPSSGLANFTFGPWYYYELILMKLIFKFDYAPFYLISLHSILFITLMYFFGKSVKDARLGLIVAFLSAISPGQTGPSAGLSNPNLVPVHAVLACIIFLKLWKKHQGWWINLIWGLIIGIGINHHYQMAALLILPLVFYASRFKRELFGGFVFMLGLLISFTPLIIFNLFNNMHTIHGISNYLRDGGGVYVPNSWTIYLKEFWPAFWSYLFGVPVWLGILLGAITILTHIYLFIKHNLSIYYIWLIAIFALFVFLLRYYSGMREYYYVLFLHPLLFLFAGYPLWILTRLRLGKLLIIVILANIFLFALPHNMQRLVDRDDHINLRNDLNILISSSHKESYRVYACGSKFDSNIMGTVFLLHDRGKLSDDGERLGIDTPNAICVLPDNVSKITSNIYNFNNMSDKQLKKDGWFSVDPEKVYIKYLKW